METVISFVLLDLLSIVAEYVCECDKDLDDNGLCP